MSFSARGNASFFIFHVRPPSEETDTHGLSTDTILGASPGFEAGVNDHPDATTIRSPLLAIPAATFIRLALGSCKVGMPRFFQNLPPSVLAQHSTSPSLLA